MTEAEWYISDADSGEVTGPLDGETVIDRIRSGAVSEDDLLWCEGMAEWRKAELFSWLLRK